MKAAQEKVTFEGSNGNTLSGAIEWPIHKRPLAWALFAHCFTCTSTLKSAVKLCRQLATRGVATLRFDFSGQGESEGDFADTNFSSNVQDLVYAARFLAENYEAPQLLMGHSLGGAAALQVAASIDSIKATAVIGAPADPAHVQHLFTDKQCQIVEEGHAEVSLGGRAFKITREFIENLNENKLDEHLQSYRGALLILHAPKDQLVGVENAAKIFAMAKHPKSYVSLDEANHLLTSPGDPEYAGDMIALWAKRYVDLASQPESTDSVIAVTSTENPFTVTLQVGAHQLVGDEPKEYGGNDLGPTPYDFLAAALGSCTVMTLKMYARRKGWDLGTVSIDLAHEKVHAKDCEDCDKKKVFDRITRTLNVSADLDEAQKKKILEIANKCPVHRTIEGCTDIVTELG